MVGSGKEEDDAVRYIQALYSAGEGSGELPRGGVMALSMRKTAHNLYNLILLDKGYQIALTTIIFSKIYITIVQIYQNMRRVGPCQTLSLREAKSLPFHDNVMINNVMTLFYSCLIEK